MNWRTHLGLALLALVYVFSYIDRQVVAVLIEPIKREFGATDTQMGLLTGLAFGLTYAALGVPVGRLADKFNRRNIVAICCGFWSVATMLCGYAGQFWQLLLARMSVAVGEAGGMAPSISLVSDLYPKKHRSLVISLFMMGPHLGVIIGLALGAWIAQKYGWRTAFISFGLPGMLLAVLVWWWVKEPKRGGFDAPNQADGSTQESMAQQLLRLIKIKSVRHICLACGLAGVAGYGYGIWVPSFLIRSHGMSLAHAGLVFGLVSGIGAVLGALFSGMVCDRLVQRDTRWQLGLPALGMLVALPCAVTFFLWPQGGWKLGDVLIPQAICFAFAFAFFASWWPSLSYSAISQVVHSSERSVTAALLNFFLTLFGSGFGPLVAGMLSDGLIPHLGSDALRWSLIAIMLLMVPSALFLLTAVSSYKQRLIDMESAPQR